MKNIPEITAEIIRMKKETDTAILAHSYQSREITEVADCVGDSYMLSVKAKEIKSRNLLVCGVHFMAQTAKMLSPDKRVFLADGAAGCPMAEQFTAEQIMKLKQSEPDRKVVAYINTTAELKSVCDVCVTSSSAVKIVGAMDCDKILFIPDCNLGAYVAEKFPQKDIKLLDGGCPVHAAITIEELEEAKKAHPDALVLVHPECRKEISAAADYAGSTSGIMEFALSSENKEFIIGTEISIVDHLQYAAPDKRFYPLSKRLICPDMKLTTLMDVYNTLKYPQEACEIVMTADLIAKASVCINEMIRLGG